MTHTMEPSASNGPAAADWVPFIEAAAAADVTEAVLAAALADGVVSFSTRLPGLEGVPMLRLADVVALRATQGSSG